MRKQFVKTVTDVFNIDSRVVLLLCDIGVFAFKELKDKYPNRVYNIGICEQSTTSLASGLSLEGMIPIVHSIAPFITERNYEQLKLNFGYQNLCGNFVSVGNSYDYAALGCTHHCPADVNILKQIPNMDIFVPGSDKEFDLLFKETYYKNNPKYFRLTEYPNAQFDVDVKSNKANVIKRGEQATIVVVGNLLDKVIEATWEQDVSIIYYTTVSNFDYKTLCENMISNKILLCEPYYSGGLTYDIMNNVKQAVRLEHVGVPHMFITNYGTKNEHDEALNLVASEIRIKLETLLNE